MFSMSDWQAFASRYRWNKDYLGVSRFILNDIHWLTRDNYDKGMLLIGLTRTFMRDSDNLWLKAQYKLHYYKADGSTNPSAWYKIVDKFNDFYKLGLAFQKENTLQHS